MDIIDTNILLRFLTGDDQEKAARCEELFKRAICEKKILYISDVCLAELVWTLESYYKEKRSGIAEKLEALVNTPGFKFSNAPILLDTIRRYRNFNVDYIDAYHGALTKAFSCKIYSYDRDFDKFKDLNRIEPGEG